MKLKKLNNTVKFNPAYKRYKGWRYFYYPIQDEPDLRWNKIGYAEGHYIHWPDYCNAIYYLK
jgi:hypothetical protein